MTPDAAPIAPALRDVFLSVGLRDQLDDLRRALAQPAPALACGRISDDGAAVAGRDGWLFLHAGHNHWHEQAAGRLPLTPEGVAAWAALLERRRRWTRERGLRYAHLFAPEKGCVYPEYLPDPAEPSPRRAVQQIVDAAGAAGDVHYPLAALRAGKGLAPTYHRGNSHWTAYGAYLACRALWAQLGLGEPDTAPLRQRPVQQDLAVKFADRPDENWHELDIGHLLTHSNEAQVTGHVGRYKVWNNPAAPHALRVLFFGDSYAYDAHLAAWFALRCREVVCLWQTALQQPLIEQLAPDIVVSQMAERFATRLPADRID